MQCYRTRSHALRTYSGPASAAQVTDFGARMFGTWTFLSCVIRLYAAYKINVREVYVLALWTYVIALGHFGAEWLVYKTMIAGKGLLPVALVPVISLTWMLIQWDFYTK